MQQTVPSAFPLCSHFERAEVNNLLVGHTGGALVEHDLTTAQPTTTVACRDFVSPEGTQDADAANVNCVSSHPTMPLVVSGHANGSVCVSDITSSTCLHCMPASDRAASPSAITSVEFDHSGFHFLAASHDGSLSVFDVRTMSRLHCWPAHVTASWTQQRLFDACFHPGQYRSLCLVC